MDALKVRREMPSALRPETGVRRKGKKKKKKGNRRRGEEGKAMEVVIVLLSVEKRFDIVR